MKLPHTITVWNRSDDEQYKRTVLTDVLWEDNRGSQLRRTGVSTDNGIFVLIPFSAAPAGFALRTDDWMMIGASDLTPKSARDLQTTGAVRISAVDKMECGVLPHWEVTGR